MKVEKIYINTYKFDFQQAKICIASIRYWYPQIPILLIKDHGMGAFDTNTVEKVWNVNIFDTEKKQFGWGYGKLEPLFLEESEVFMVLDADTVMLGPVLDKIAGIEADFLVDNEVQPKHRFLEIYYNLDRINEIDPQFLYPGYSFNSGQWIGTSGLLQRSDFDDTLLWTTPPIPRYPDIVFNGDQAHLNFVLHRLESQGKVRLRRIELMLFPEQDTADFIDIALLKKKSSSYPLILHWAGMKIDFSNNLPRVDIYQFFESIYYSRLGIWVKFADLFICKLYLIQKNIRRYKAKSIQKWGLK